MILNLYAVCFLAGLALAAVSAIILAASRGPWSGSLPVIIGTFLASFGAAGSAAFTLLATGALVSFLLGALVAATISAVVRALLRWVALPEPPSDAGGGPEVFRTPGE